MRVPGVITAVALGLSATAADAEPHATGAMFELRYAPESDVSALPLANSYLTIGYMDERVAFGVSVGLARNTLDDSSFNMVTTTQSWVTVGPTIRGVFARSTDGATALVGEGTASLTEITSSTISSGIEQQTTPVPTPFRIELGLGVRYWVVPSIGVGAALLGHYTYSTFADQTETQVSLGGAVYLVGVL